MPATSLTRRPAFVLLLGLCGLAAVTTLLGRLAGGRQTQTKPTALSGVQGPAAYPAFSFDGNRLAYSERGESKDDSFHIYMRRVPTGAVTPLTSGEANDISPAWSPDGAHIAFLRINEGKAQCVVIPSAGGPEKVIAEFPAAATEQPLPELSWSRDGRTLAAVVGGTKQSAAIALLPATGGEPRRVTTPPEGSDGDWSPAFSPDGAKLAFARGATVDNGDLYVAGADGANPQRLTFDENGIRGITWTANGDLIYASPRFGRVRLWRIAAAGGSPHEVIGAGNEARFPAASFAGNRLVYTESPMVTSIWRAPLDGAGGAERPLLRSNGRERLASYSPDGKRIADLSSQSGAEEIWVSDAEGNNRLQVTNFGAAAERPQIGRPVWSPDSKWLLFDDDNGRGDEIWKTLAEPGAKPVRVLAGGHGASWSHDGKSIYYAQHGQVWKASADGGHPEQVTQRGIGNGAPAESVDGKFVYFRVRGASIWRVPASGGAEEEVAVDNDGPLVGDPVVFKNGIYYVTVERFGRFESPLTVYYYDFAAKSARRVFRLTGRNFGFTPLISVSPDGKYLLFARAEQSVTSLMLVENFK
jgi:Tol biopolymer transport system component